MRVNDFTLLNNGLASVSDLLLIKALKLFIAAGISLYMLPACMVVTCVS